MRQTPWRREISCFSWTTLPWDTVSASATIVRQKWYQAPTQEGNNDDSDKEWKPNTPHRWWGGGVGVDNTVEESVPLTAKALRHLLIGPPHRWSTKKGKCIMSPTKHPSIRQIQGVLQQRCNGKRVSRRNIRDGKEKKILSKTDRSPTSPNVTTLLTEDVQLHLHCWVMRMMVPNPFRSITEMEGDLATN